VAGGEPSEIRHMSNIYVDGSALFPPNRTANPFLTAMAWLSTRLM
jgi:hypothetical protein